MTYWQKWRLNVAFVAAIAYGLNNWAIYLETEKLKDEIFRLKTEQPSI